MSSLQEGCLHELSWPAFPPGSAYALFLALCLWEKASWPDSPDLDYSSRNPSTLVSLLSHINTMTVFKANKASRASGARYSGPAWIASYKEALKLPIKGLEIPGGGGGGGRRHTLNWPKRVYTRTVIERRFKWLARYVRYNVVLLYRCSFPYILLQLSWSIQLFRERLSVKMCTRQSRRAIWDMIRSNTLFLTL